MVPNSDHGPVPTAKSVQTLTGHQASLGWIDQHPEVWTNSEYTLGWAQQAQREPTETLPQEPLGSGTLDRGPSSILRQGQWGGKCSLPLG